MSPFVPSDPAQQAHLLGPDAIHVWRLPYHPDAGRTPVQRLLAAYLGVRPEQIEFVVNEYGRPSLAAPRSDLDFNWSHSGAMAVLAVAHSLPILGVDFETHRPRPHALRLARRFFHPDESSTLEHLDPAAVDTGFLRLWTAKEAVLKALGEGLRFGLDRVAFRLHNGHVHADTFSPEAGPIPAWNLQRADDEIGFCCLAWRDAKRVVCWFDLAES